MSLWKLRVGGLLLIVVGGYLFVYSIRDISNEWPQIFFGLLSVFFISMGFGLLIMPSQDPDPIPTPQNNSDLSE